MAKFWVNYDYYLNEYLLGKAPTIPEDDFDFYVRDAQNIINWRKKDIEKPASCLKNCTCEVAELVFKKTSQQDIQKAITKNLVGTEYHNDFVYCGI